MGNVGFLDYVGAYPCGRPMCDLQPKKREKLKHWATTSITKGIAANTASARNSNIGRPQGYAPTYETGEILHSANLYRNGRFANLASLKLLVFNLL